MSGHAPLPLQPNDPAEIGPYRVLGRLGQGGQGQVYLAQRPGGDRVAVKILWTGASHDSPARRRFALELLAARRVPRVCTAVVLDADMQGETPYIVSEYVAGPSLQEAIDNKGVLDGSALERLATYTATALAAIHGARVVHRDFKPANVLLGPDGPRVVDFGIAQALENTSLHPSMHTKGIIGTCPYMAPEQFGEGDVSPAADVHAWAATVVFAATGQPPYGEGNIPAVMYRVLNEPPRLDGLAEPLRGLVSRCLAKRPEDRPTSLQMLQMLIEPGPVPPISAPPLPPSVPLRTPPPPHQVQPPAHGSGPAPVRAPLPPLVPPQLLPFAPPPVPPLAPPGDGGRGTGSQSAGPQGTELQGSAEGVPPLYLVVGGMVHVLGGDHPHTAGGPGSSIEIPYVWAPGDLIYIRHRGVWRLNVRLPGADIQVEQAKRDGSMVAFDTPDGRCVIRGEVNGIPVKCQISLNPPAQPHHPPHNPTPGPESTPGPGPGPGPGLGPGAGPGLTLPWPGGPTGSSSQVTHHTIGDVTVLGSGDEANVRVRGMDVAAEHATLLRTQDGFRLRDHGKGGGTFIAGRSVLWAILHTGDAFSIADTTFRLLSDRILESRPAPQADLIAHEVNARYGSIPALQDLSFALGHGQFMAIVGPSGAGKSSLFRALLGELPITGGTLLFRGLDLVTDGEQIRHLLGYLPQQDHLHKSLTVRQNLRYAARLRLPADLPRKDREARILEIVDRLGLTERIDLRAARLSGGQLKRLSIALEILSDPLLLLLDEPTSGLDPGLDQEVMRLLKEIAGRGCSVIVVTHTPDNLILTDQVLVLGAGGRPVYVGAPQQILPAMEVNDYPELMRKLSQGALRPVRDPAGPSASPAPPVPGTDPALRPQRTGASALRQFWVFTRREAALLRARGPIGLITPFALAVVGALLTAALSVAGEGPPSSNPVPVLTMLVTVCALAGQALTYNNLVSEYDITAREYRSGLSPGALVSAKFVIFGIVAIAQGMLAAVVYIAIQGELGKGLLPLSFVLELCLPLSCLALASMGLGLAVSALASTPEKAVGFATVAAIVQVALNGSLFKLMDPLATVAVAVPARWAFAAGATLVEPLGPKDALWNQTVGQLTTNLSVLLLLAGVYTAIAWLLLRRRLVT